MKKKLTHLSQMQLLLTLIPVLMILFSSCKKEKALSETGLDTNYYVNHDNPDSPVDHAIYNFYKSTGVAGFYTDTIAKVKISSSGKAEERFKYIILKPQYQLTSNAYLEKTKLSDKQWVPGLLDLIKSDVLTRIPENYFIQCLYFVDKFRTGSHLNFKIHQGNTAYIGFDAVVVQVSDVSSMSEDDKKMYASSLLAGLAVNKVMASNAAYLQSSFFDISRKAFPRNAEADIYTGLPYMLMGMMPSPQPGTLGFLSHFIFPLGGVMELEAPPVEEEDLRNFLTMTFRYTKTEFEFLYASYPLVIQKFNMVRELAVKAGFAVPQ